MREKAQKGRRKHSEETRQERSSNINSGTINSGSSSSTTTTTTTAAATSSSSPKSASSQALVTTSFLLSLQSLTPRLKHTHCSFFLFLSTASVILAVNIKEEEGDTTPVHTTSTCVCALFASFFSVCLCLTVRPSVCVFYLLCPILLSEDRSFFPIPCIQIVTTHKAPIAGFYLLGSRSSSLIVARRFQSALFTPSTVQQLVHPFPQQYCAHTHTHKLLIVTTTRTHDTTADNYTLTLPPAAPAAPSPQQHHHH